MRAWVIRALFHKIETALLRIPLVNSVYSALKDFWLAEQRDNSENLQVVSLTCPEARFARWAS